jgi:hypothetical protein
MRTSILATMALAIFGCSAPVHTDDTPNQQNPADTNYVPGPYGYSQGSIMQNIQFTGKVDPGGAAGMADYNTMPMAPITLASYHNDPSVKVLFISGVARWCAPCNDEQTQVPTVQAKYEPKGVRFLEALIEGQERGTPATEKDLNFWATFHSLHVAMALDPTDAVHQYADIAAFPLNMIVTTSDMKIQLMQTGEITDLDGTLAQYAP